MNIKNCINYFAVAGYPISHSKSPLIFNYFFKNKRALKIILSLLNLKNNKKEILKLINLQKYSCYLRISENDPFCLKNTLNQLNIEFLNITSPLKEQFCNFPDIKSKLVLISNAVNTVIKTGIKNKKKYYYGTNTDIIAIYFILKEYFNKIKINNTENTGKNTNVLILGAGGAAKAVVSGLLMFFKNISVDIFNRTCENAFILKNLIENLGKKKRFANNDFNNIKSKIDIKKHERYINETNFIKTEYLKVDIVNRLENIEQYDLIINTIPSEKFLKKLFEKIDFTKQITNKKIYILDAYYKNSYFEKNVKNNKNIIFISGYKWLIYQAISGYILFFKISLEKWDTLNKIDPVNLHEKEKEILNIDVNKFIEIYDLLYKKLKKEILLDNNTNSINNNIIFTGFMFSGKSTVANQLESMVSQKDGSDNLIVIDTDKEIEKYCNMSINRIFEIYGEKYFRKIESKIIRSIVKDDRKMDHFNNYKQNYNKNRFKFGNNKFNNKFNNEYCNYINNTIKIISTGGGIILKKKNQKLLKKLIKRKIYYKRSNMLYKFLNIKDKDKCYKKFDNKYIKYNIVWLYYDVKNIIDRINHTNIKRPLLVKNIVDIIGCNENNGNNRSTHQKIKLNAMNLYNKRELLYSRFSDIVINTDCKKTKEVAKMVIGEYLKR